MGEIHVMNPDELENLPDGAVVWREQHSYRTDKESIRYERLMPMIMYNGIIANYYEYILPDELRAMDDIQLRYRYWSHRPTIETMDKEPWIMHEEWKV